MGVYLELSNLNLPELYERLRHLYQLKHKSSPDRRLPKIEKEIGKIKHTIHIKKMLQHDNNTAKMSFLMKNSDIVIYYYYLKKLLVGREK